MVLASCDTLTRRLSLFPPDSSSHPNWTKAAITRIPLLLLEAKPQCCVTMPVAVKFDPSASFRVWAFSMLFSNPMTGKFLLLCLFVLGVDRVSVIEDPTPSVYTYTIVVEEGAGIEP